MKDAPIKAIAPWFGGKRTLAGLILEQLGDHKQYFEPFCGSMAVLMAKEPSQKETVCDLHGELYDGWRVVECGTNKQLAQQNKRDKGGKTKAPEILLVNKGPNDGKR